MSKSIGQIAFEAFSGREALAFSLEAASRRMSWELAAQAVRQAVLEEAAQELEGPLRSERVTKEDRETVVAAVWAIRSLKNNSDK